MPTRVALTPQNLRKNNYAVVAGDLKVNLAAADPTNKEKIPFTGKEILVIQNIGVSSHTITLTSIADSAGRLDTSLTAYAIPAGEIHIIELAQVAGWNQTGNFLFLEANHAEVKWGVVKRR